MSLWFNRKSRKDSATVSAPVVRPVIPTEISEDSATTITHARRMNHWLDEAFNECKDNGGFDHLRNKGKPVEVTQGDVLNSILKNANILPPWLELQHEIRDDIRRLLQSSKEMDRSPASMKYMKQALEDVNKKINRYNTMVPTSILQKRRVSEEKLDEHLKLWE